MIHLQNSNSHLIDLNGIGIAPGAEQIQPNAIDLRLDTVSAFTSSFKLTKEKTFHRDTLELQPGKDNMFWLESSKRSYNITFDQKIQIGHDEVGWLIPRSSLNRNGVTITSGLYDSGYKGIIGGAIHVSEYGAFIEKGARIAQLLIFKANSIHQYDGQYQEK